MHQRVNFSIFLTIGLSWVRSCREILQRSHDATREWEPPHATLDSRAAKVGQNETRLVRRRNKREVFNLLGNPPLYHTVERDVSTRLPGPKNMAQHLATHVI